MGRHFTVCDRDLSHTFLGSLRKCEDFIDILDIGLSGLAIAAPTKSTFTARRESCSIAPGAFSLSLTAARNHP
jgi:hypothetical protein